MIATHNKGYTLLEIMIAMVIAAILLTVAVPSLTNFIKNNKMLAETNGLMIAIKTARSEAMSQRTFVTVCSSTNGTACGGAWEDGYISFLDTDGSRAVNGAEVIIFYKSREPSSIEISYAPANVIRFDSRGRALGFSGTMTFCDDRGDDFRRGITIEAIGRSSPATIEGGTLATCPL